jgi:demethylmenaquinone methyltransferase/2-methoxy-6-polyprenyl-1,4-benzoquinol methylase
MTMTVSDDVRQDIVEIYRKRAANYDFTANLYYLIGYPEWRYRRRAIERLQLKAGDTVVELGCGTGLNFGLVQEKIGPEGKLIGVDLTDAMLEQAQQRVEQQGWENVELIQQDIAGYSFPEGVDAIYSTFALSLVPQAPEVIRRGARALNSNGHWSLLDFEIPEKWPGWLVEAMLLLVKPFTPTEEWVSRKPWPEIKAAMRRELDGLVEQNYYLGMTYIISGRPTR